MKLNRRDFVGTIGLGAVGLFAGGGVTAALAEPSGGDGELSFVNPELRPFARQFQAMPAMKFTPETIVQARKTPFPAVPFLPDVPVEEKHIPVPGGAPDVLVYVINRKPGFPRPAIVHTHGGGFIFSTAKLGVPDLQRTAAELDCVIVTVDYRLAPETIYSGSMADNYAGLLWTYRHAAELGVDPARIALMGESAGGGHAALLAQMARDRGEVPVMFQVLIYPMLDDRTGSTKQPPKNVGTIGWSVEANRFGWQCFLGQEPGTRRAPAAAVPARATSLAGLPPAFIGVGSIDLFVDEDIEYAHRLVDAGVATELLVVPGAFHGFDMLGAPGSMMKSPYGQPAISKFFNAAKMDALKRAFAGQF